MLPHARTARWLFSIAMALGFAMGPAPMILAAGHPADLKIEFASYDQNKHEAHMKVVNVGDDVSPPTTLQLQTLAPGANTGKTSNVNVPALKGSEAFQYAYKLGQDCAAGVRIQAQATLAGDPSPEDNTLLAYPCQPDLKLSFQGRQSDQDLQFRVANLGGVGASATTLHFESETTPPSNPVDIKVPALAAGQSKTVDYVMTAPCPGLAVKGRVSLDDDADPSNNMLQLFACDADLTLKYQGFLPNSDRNMSFVVSNIGGATSPATTAQLATLSTVTPAPQTNQREVPIPPLDSGASYPFTYSLPSACDGNTVQASVALDSDPNQANLSTQVQACSPIPLDQKLPVPGAPNVVLPPPPPPDTQVQRGGASDIARDVALATPDYLQPGDHEMNFSPTIVQQRDRSTGPSNNNILAGCGPQSTLPDPGWTAVGWAQGLSGGCVTIASETALRFDISPLLQGGPKLVTSARLTMNEQPLKWTDGDGNTRTVAGCVAAVGVASTDFVADPPTGNNMYSNDTYVDVTPSAATQFDVTQPVAFWFGPESPHYGFVLKGSIEDLQNDDHSSCWSEVSNLQLTVDYTVL